jgi:hypothetical protein
MGEGYIAGLWGLALAAGTEIVAVTTDLTHQKVRETNLLDRSHFVDGPRTPPAVGS